MTVKQLISKLQSQNPNAQIVLSDDSTGPEVIFELESICEMDDEMDEDGVDNRPTVVLFPGNEASYTDRGSK